jgi:hypothetical protein
MPNVTRQQEAAEAICSMLFQTDFECLGESGGGASTWWRRGTKPKVISVEVQRSKLAEYVTVKTQWLNLSMPGRVVRGQEVFQIPTDSTVSTLSIRGSAEAACVRVLEIFKDVLQGEGVAGREALAHLSFE